MKTRMKLKKSFVDIIGSLVLLASPLSIFPLAKLLGVDTWSISSQVDPLRSVIDVPEDDSPLQLFHLSFRDYILSQSAGNLQVSETETQARLTSRCLGLMRGTLKVDICGLLSPGKSHSDIEPSTIDEHLSIEIQYACLYWVHHLKSTGSRIHDDDDAYSFLQSFFTNWFEVSCLLRRVDDSLRMLQELQSLVDVSSIRRPHLTPTLTIATGGFWTTSTAIHPRCNTVHSLFPRQHRRNSSPDIPLRNHLQPKSKYCSHSTRRPSLPGLYHAVLQHRSQLAAKPNSPGP